MAGRRLLLVLLSLLGACGSLAPGKSSERDVIAAMGRPAETVALPDGSRILWYPQPVPDSAYGTENFAATIGPDGRLRSFEQRLAPQYIAKLIPEQSRASDVRQLIGPPQRAYPLLSKSGEMWEYFPMGFQRPVTLYVEISPQDTVRSVSVMERRGTGRRPSQRSHN